MLTPHGSIPVPTPRRNTRIVMMHPAKVMIAVGVIVAGLGVVWLALSRLGISPGRLPGDVTVRGENYTVSFPLVTCLLLSALLTAVGWLAMRWRGPQ